ncbi:MULTISPECIES: hypothetical protein [unclassified Fictibacillus]|nr:MULTISPECIES: hypothetical protein [unclassified Fictibacillus]MED2973014.1 hypothetical protein [Fictibacillus sp. B-59209]
MDFAFLMAEQRIKEAIDREAAGVRRPVLCSSRILLSRPKL